MIYPKSGLEQDLQEKGIAYNLDLIKDQEDLHYVEAILVSCGINKVNKNDDVFVKEEAWNARHTPIHKQFNFRHKEGDVIGHIVSSYVVSDGKIIPDDTPIEEVPDEFDIVVGSVIYKKFRDDKLQTRIDTLIKEIAEDKWFVSMECWHKSFDYLLISPAGEKKVVARNEKTSFLTKHLRRYKGTGSYEGYKIARILKGFYFSGKGLVENPANPDSVFVTHAEENKMSYSEAQYKALEDKLALAEKQAKEAADKTVAQEIDGYKIKIKELEGELKSKTESTSEKMKELSDSIAKLENELKVAQEVAKNKTEQCEVLEKTKAELESKISEQTTALEKIEQEKIKISRLSKLNKVDISEDKAKSLVEQFITIAEDQFDLIVNSLPSKKVKDEKTESSVIDDLESDEPQLAVANTDQAKELRSATSAWLKQSFIKGRVKNGS